ncbi:MAG: transcription antitermination factor NusB [Filomicrobium sp.]
MNTSKAPTARNKSSHAQTARTGKNKRSNKSNAKKPGPASEAASSPTQGLTARDLAVDLIVAVLLDQRSFDEALAGFLKKPRYQNLEARDRGLARSIAANALRYAGPLEEVLSNFIDNPLPAKHARVFAILLATATQLLILKVPPHAAINLAVDQTRKNKKSTHLAKFTNAVLRRVSERGAALFEELDRTRKCIPDWLWESWVAAYGEERTRAIAEACLIEAPLDISLKDADESTRWAEALNAQELATGSLRYYQGGRVEELPGFAEGTWWVQDAAAALPAGLLGDVSGKKVADICAAPGGKTAQLAAAGAHVTAVDVSAGRLRRVEENLKRLKLSADLVEADATHWQPGEPFDAILLDAPCSATGTIRRHPDILHLKHEAHVAALADVQMQILQNTAKMLGPGGRLVYCTCSLQPAEGERQIEKFLSETPNFERVPIKAGEAGIAKDWLTPEGDLRTLPCHAPEQIRAAQGTQSSQNEPEQPNLQKTSAPKTGMDGFFAARLIRRS